jgi:hypothetical protein
MLTEGNPTPQGKGSSTRAESTRVGTASLRHFGPPNPDQASSILPLNSTVASEPFKMDVDDVSWSTDDHVAG